ncbi:MAG: hypothetical protein AAF721_12725 [Myxococcota bacterium]
MNIQLTTRLSLFALLCTTAIAGCDDSEPGEPSEPGVEGADDGAEGEAPPMCDDDCEEPADAPPAEAIQFAGAWSLNVVYSVECEGLGQVHEADHDADYAMPLEGPNDALSFSDGWVELTGAGDNDRVQLTGGLRIEGAFGTGQSGPENRLSFNGIDVSEDEVAGDLSGSFLDSNGFDCTIIDGNFTLTR